MRNEIVFARTINDSDCRAAATRDTCKSLSIGISIAQLHNDSGKQQPALLTTTIIATAAAARTTTTTTTAVIAPTTSKITIIIITTTEPSTAASVTTTNTTTVDIDDMSNDRSGAYQFLVVPLFGSLQLFDGVASGVVID